MQKKKKRSPRDIAGNTEEEEEVTPEIYLGSQKKKKKRSPRDISRIAEEEEVTQRYI